MNGAMLAARHIQSQAKTAGCGQEDIPDILRILSEQKTSVSATPKKSIEHLAYRMLLRNGDTEEDLYAIWCYVIGCGIDMMYAYAFVLLVMKIKYLLTEYLERHCLHVNGETRRAVFEKFWLLVENPNLTPGQIEVRHNGRIEFLSDFRDWYAKAIGYATYAKNADVAS